MSKTTAKKAKTTTGRTNTVRVVAMIHGNTLEPPLRFVTTDPQPATRVDRELEVERAKELLLTHRRNTREEKRQRIEIDAELECREQFKYAEEYEKLFHNHVKTDTVNPCNATSKSSDSSKIRRGFITEFAEIAGVNVRTVRNWKSGKTVPEALHIKGRDKDPVPFSCDLLLDEITAKEWAHAYRCIKLPAASRVSNAIQEYLIKKRLGGK